jgi:hypothetical protein
MASCMPMGNKKYSIIQEKRPVGFFLFWIILMASRSFCCHKLRDRATENTTSHPEGS